MDHGPTLTVDGRAEVSVRPDRAVVSLGAIAQADQAAAAQEQINQVMARTLAALKEAGIAEENIQTASLSIYPVYSEPERPRPMQQGGQAEPRIVGYRASNTVRVVVDDLTAVGKVIDAGITAGANQLEGVSFELKDDTAARAEALKAAAANARQKADALAAATGVTLAEMRQIRESGVQVITPPMFRGGRTMLAMEAATPVQPGQVRVEAQVTITYRIAGHGIK